MNWLCTTFSSSIGKKTLMAASGFFLGFFLLIHAVGNFTALLGRELFISYAGHLHAYDAILPFFETGLLAFFIIHVLTATVLYFQNLAARPNRYAYYSPRGRSFASRTMAYTGLIMLIFICVHLLNFHFSSQTGTVADRVRLLLRHPGYNIFYLVSLAAVIIHVGHGFWSMFQSLGINHSKYNRALSGGAWAAGLIAGAVFIVICLQALFNESFLL